MIMKIIGLTGNIGCGKSTVARFLQELGADCIDADKVGHEIYNPGTPGWQETVETFGQDILSPEGTIDRKKLSQKVFNNPEAVARLNRILHPKIRQAVEKRLDEARRRGKEVAVVEAILLVEAGWMDMVDVLWLVVAPHDLTLKRLKERGLPEPEALARMAAQTPPEKLKQYAGEVIHNDGDLAKLKSTVENLWRKIHNEVAGP
jgi:dephospho-CoA kinase